jgi:hypothetical protein
VRTDGSAAGWTTYGGGTEAEIATVADPDVFVGEYLGTLDGRNEAIRLSRAPDATIAADRGCAVSPAAVRQGVSVISLATPNSAAAIGALDPSRSDADIEAFLATSPTGPPPWFALAGLLQTGGGTTAAEALLQVPPGGLTVVCLGSEGTRTVVKGRATLAALR